MKLQVTTRFCKTTSDRFQILTSCGILVTDTMYLKELNYDHYKIVSQETGSLQYLASLLLIFKHYVSTVKPQ